jgi:4-hydroxybenzoate polyprenyltransferase
MRANGTELERLLPIGLVLYLALGGVLCTLAAMRYMGERPDPVVGLIFAGFIFSIYILNRFTDRREDFLNDIASYVFFAKHTVIFAVGIVASIAVVTGLVATLRFHSYHLLLIASGVFYSFHLIPWYERGRGLVFRRLKDIPLFKNILVAVLWGSAVFMIPILFTGHSLTTGAPLYLLMIALTVSTFSNTLFGDILDEKGDRLAGTRTVPTLIGAKRSYLIIAMVNLVWIVACTALLATGSLQPDHFLFFLVLTLYPAVYIVPHLFNALSRQALELLSESDLILFASGLALLSVI